jgi:hypothetical protein
VFPPKTEGTHSAAEPPGTPTEADPHPAGDR